MKRLALRAPLPLLLAVSLLTSCRQEAAVVSFEKLKTCPAEYDKKDVAVEAYLTLDSQGKLFCVGVCSVEVNSEPASGPRQVIAQVKVGKGPNQIEESPDFMHDQPGWQPDVVADEEHMRRFYESLRVRTDGGKIVRLKDKVRLTGSLEVWPTEGNCFLRVERIEQP